MTIRRDEQREFLHGGSMSLEFFARSLFGDKYYGSANYTEMNFWRKFYRSTIEVLEEPFISSVVLVDRKHREDISNLFGRVRTDL